MAYSVLDTPTNNWPSALMPSETYGITFNSFAFALAITLGLAAYALHGYLHSPWRNLPPGPTGYPIIGSAHKFSDSNWLINECPKHGEVVYLNVASQPVIVLNSQRAAADILDRRGATTSGRPRLIVAGELICNDLLLVLEPHNDRWHRQRRAVHEGFNKAAVHRFHPALEEDAIYLATALSHGSSVIREEYHNYACSITLAVTYDRPLRGSSQDDALRARIEKFVKKVQAAAAPGAHVVEMIPWMLWLPDWMVQWKRDALDTYRDATSFFLDLVDEVDIRAKQGTARACLTSTLTGELERFQISKLEAAWAAGTMYGGGSDTTTIILEWWTLAMIAFPDAQRRAQAELDTVVGRGRVPSFVDRKHLPYTVAVMREVMRWRTSLPLAVPHSADADEWYEGMFIPKGTILVANILPCNRDPAVYGSDAHLFKPERHLDEQGRLKPAPPLTKDHGHVSFGFGRRNCVGQYVAEDALFIASSVLLWAFDFSKKLDGEGREIDVDVEGFDASGLTLRANHFECSITSRFPDAFSVLAGERELRAV